MKRLIRVTLLSAAVIVFITMGAVMAAGFKSPVEILSELSGQPVEDLSSERLAGESYGMMAENHGVLDEFRQQMLEQKGAILDKKVEGGYLAKEKAEEIKDRMGSFCDGGSGGSHCGRELGAGFGLGNGGVGRGPCNGKGYGPGNGAGRGAGYGPGRR